MITLYLFVGLVISLALLGAWKLGEVLVDAWHRLSQRRADRRRRRGNRIPLGLALSPEPATREHQLRRLVRLR